MLNPLTQNLRYNAIQFLEQSPQQRQQILKQLGIARYDFLTKISMSEANIACVMRFFQNPNQLKFPNLVGADLSGLILDHVNFIRGNLSQANLQGSSLVNADLLFANFADADLRNADLTGATLNETIWLGTLVDECQFGEGMGGASQFLFCAQQIKDTMSAARNEAIPVGAIASSFLLAMTEHYYLYS